MQHVLLTRFNVRLRWHAQGDTRWTDDRLDLFARTLLPSVKAQTSHDFVWLVFFDESTTPEQRERIRRLGEDGAVFQPVWTSGVFDVGHVRDEVARRWPDADLLLTTRVDNDDALARDFMATVRSSAEQMVDRAPVFLNPTSGVQFDGRLLYARPWPYNAFVSLLEVGDDPRTVFVDQHYSIAQHGPVVEIGSGAPLWLQSIHGGNVANRVNGLPVRRVEAVTRRFALDLPARPAGPRDLVAAVGRVAYRTVRDPGKLRGPARVVASRVRRVLRRTP